MRSTWEANVPPYLGIDLTDRYASNCRDIDVCGLTPTEDGNLISSFWHWEWDPGHASLDVASIAKELKASRAAMIDGPHGLAAPGNALRECERQCAAAGKTPDVRPRLGSPFAGFICSSLDLFAALEQAGVRISPSSSLGGVCEVYPGHIWRIFAGRALPKKSSVQGRLARKRILEALRVSSLPTLPTHDQNDACVAAILAAAADGAVRGIGLKTIGSPLTSNDGTLREGFMVIPEVGSNIHELISRISLGASADNAVRKRRKKTSASRNVQPEELANDLLTCFIEQTLKGNPTVCTYSWAYRYLFHASYNRWSQAFARMVIEVARQTPLQALPGMGAVRLDTFVVNRENRLPSDGHWQSVQYEREDWERMLGRSTVLD